MDASSTSEKFSKDLLSLTWSWWVLFGFSGFLTWTCTVFGFTTGYLVPALINLITTFPGFTRGSGSEALAAPVFFSDIATMGADPTAEACLCQTQVHKRAQNDMCTHPMLILSTQLSKHWPVRQLHVAICCECVCMHPSAKLYLLLQVLQLPPGMFQQMWSLPRKLNSNEKWYINIYIYINIKWYIYIDIYIFQLLKRRTYRNVQSNLTKQPIPAPVDLRLATCGNFHG